MSKEETVEVTFRLPKWLFDLLEKEDYLGWNKEHFFVAAARHVISGELSEMEPQEAKKLKAKYGEKIDCIPFKTTKTLEAGEK